MNIAATSTTTKRFGGFGKKPADLPNPTPEEIAAIEAEDRERLGPDVYDRLKAETARSADLERQRRAEWAAQQNATQRAKSPEAPPKAASPNSHPPIILQATEEEFKAAIEHEFIVGSAISPELFHHVAKFASDLDEENGEIIGEPIAEFLGWTLKSSQAGFANRQQMYALLMFNGDGTPHQAKLNQQTWNAQKGRYGKAYKAPKSKVGDFPRAYLPSVDAATHERCGVPVGVDFWEYIEQHPEIPVVITEGNKKGMCGLSHGHVTISLYGRDAGYKRVDGNLTLIPDLARFCQPGRTFIIAFDEDENPDTIEATEKAASILAYRLRNQVKGITVTVKVASWENSQGKGIDDLVVNCGPEALATAISSATIPIRETSWQCLPSHNHQLGEWEYVNTGNDNCNYSTDEIEDRASWDPNVVVTGAVEKGVMAKIFTPQANFDFKVVKSINGIDGGGLELLISWVENGKVTTKSAYVRTADLVAKDGKFITALTGSLGGYFSSILKPAELTKIIANRKAAYSRRGGKTYRLAECIGQMPDGVWVFEDRQFTPNGQICTEKESGWVFNRALISGDDASPSPKIVDANPLALTELANSLKLFYDAGALPSVWLTLGYAVMGLHRQCIMAAAGSVAGLTIYGEKGGGKSLAQAAAASLYGLQDFSLSAVTPSKFAQYCKVLSGLTLQWDDPIPQDDKGGKIQAQVESALWRLYTGLARDVRGNNQTPKTIAAVSTNRVLGTSNTAIMTRLISFIFPKIAVNRQAGAAAKQAMIGASGGLPQLLAIPYPHESIVEQGNQLTEFLSESDPRNAQSLATLAHYTQAFCDLAGVEFDALTYIKTDVCPQANEQAAGKCSLEDFLEKLAIFHGENKVGEWNVLEWRDRTTNEEFLAVHMPSVWESFNARFAPGYGSAIVAALAVEGGGRKNTNVRMVRHRDSVLAYQKALNNWEMHLGDKPTPLNRDGNPKCLLIPKSIAAKCGFFGGGDSEPEEVAAPIVAPPVDDFEAQPAAPPTAVTTALPVGECPVESPPAQTKPLFTPTHKLADGTPVIIEKRIGNPVTRAAVRDGNGKAQNVKIEEIVQLDYGSEVVA
jgi:hypothetical protein